MDPSTSSTYFFISHFFLQIWIKKALLQVRCVCVCVCVCRVLTLYRGPASLLDRAHRYGRGWRNVWCRNDTSKCQLPRNPSGRDNTWNNIKYLKHTTYLTKWANVHSGVWKTPIPIQFMHQNENLDGLKKSSETIHCICVVSEDLLRPFNIWFWCINWFGFISFFYSPCIRNI